MERDLLTVFFESLTAKELKELIRRAESIRLAKRSLEFGDKNERG